MPTRPSSDPQARLSHLDTEGAVHMVDVGHKPETARRARAEAVVRLGPAALQALHDNPKGELFATARLAGIQAAKRTGELIPLCHPLPLTHVSVDLRVEGDTLRIEVCTETVGRTGVEMEAMTAACVTALTVYDMLKAVDRSLVIEGVQLIEKLGGKSGHWRRPQA